MWACPEPVACAVWVCAPLDEVEPVHVLEASKSNAIKQLRTMLDCEKLIVFGDGKNDIEMLSTVGCGIAMGNANDEVKKSSRMMGNFN